MKVSLKLFATLSRYLPQHAQKMSCLELDLEPGTSLQALLAQQRIPPEQCALLLINGVFVPPPERVSRLLFEGDTIAIWPPVGGG